MEISFPKTAEFAYNPGQYIYLAIPEISWLQWHPFSFSSSPNQKVVRLHIRRAGNWTSSLFELAQKQTEVSMLVEGPYGNLSVDIMGDRKYKNIMLISGGIGGK
jgi:predicted ferric reductase